MELFEQFARVEWLLHRFHQHNHRQHGPMGDPHRGQGRVLTILKMQPEISQKELTFLLDMRPQSLGELLTKLEKGGFITRTPSEADRRIMNIKLTEEGAKAASATEGDRPTGFDDLFDCLSDAEQTTLSELLTKIIESIEKQLGDDDAQSPFEWREGGRPPFTPEQFARLREMGEAFGRGGMFGRGRGPFRGGWPFGFGDRGDGSGCTPTPPPAPPIPKKDQSGE